MQRVLLLIVTFLTLSFSLIADDGKPVVRASLSRDTILIGDQFTLDVEVDKDMMQIVDFPILKGQIMGDTIEVLKMFPIDTIKTDGRQQTIKISYLLTCFEAGAYSLGEFPVLYAEKNIVDTLLSHEILDIYVKTFIIDTTTQGIADIKPQMETPLNWAELKEYIFNKFTLVALIILLLIAAIIYLVVKKRRTGSIFAPKAVEPPHVVAMRELQKLKNQKLWENHKHKSYYTALTDILRVYICGRYDVDAMEMTSDEIIKACKSLDIPERQFKAMNLLLELADLAKFAKFIPSDQENEECYHIVYYFVEETKLMPQQEEDKEEEV